MADLNPEVFEDLQVAERSRPLFEAAGLRLRTWEAYALAFNERNLLRREMNRIAEGRGSSDIHPEVVERLRVLRTELDPIVDQLRKFLPPEPADPDDRERQEMVLGFIAVSPTARDVAAKWIAVQEAGGEVFRRLREQDKQHQIEQVGADLRAKMPFLKPVVVDAGQAQAVASSAPGGEG